MEAAMANERHPFAWVGDLRRVVGDKLMADIVEDFRRGPAAPGPTLPPVKVMGAGTVKTAGEEVQRGTGWTEAPSTANWRAPGIDLIDEMCAQQDQIDRQARIRELAGTQHSRRLAEAAREAEDKDKAHKEKGPKA
jgi:hypothetical protein